MSVDCPHNPRENALRARKLAQALRIGGLQLGAGDDAVVFMREAGGIVSGIDGNDDALCLKSGRDSDGLRFNRPTYNVKIHDSIIRRGPTYLGLMTVPPGRTPPSR